MKAIATATMLAFVAGPVVADEALGKTIRDLAAAHRGRVAVAVKRLDGGEAFFLNADEPMPTASLIKFMVMLEVYQQALEGKIRLADPVTLRKDDRVPGAGILTYHFSDGASFPLRDAVRLMMVYSHAVARRFAK